MAEFDIACLDTRTLSTKGVKFLIKDPRTGKQWRNAAKEPLYVLLAGRNSSTFESLQQLANENRTAYAARDVEFTAEEIREERIAYVAGCTMGWNFDNLDGKPFPYSEGNAQLLWENKRFNWLMNQAFDFVLNEANFLGDTPDA